MAAGRLLVDSGPPLSHNGSLTYRNGCPGDRARSAPSVGPAHLGVDKSSRSMVFWTRVSRYSLGILSGDYSPGGDIVCIGELFSCQSNNGSPNDINPPQFPCKKAWCVPAGAERLRAPRPHTRLSAPPTVYRRLTFLPIRLCMSISDISTPPQSFQVRAELAENSSTFPFCLVV